MAEHITPNHYTVSGQGTSVSYSTTSLDGTPRLSFKKGKQTMEFSGDQIERVKTQIGEVVTVTIATTVDKGFTTFSVLIPAINLPADAAKQAFTTVGITTVHRTSIGGPVEGAEESYKTVTLKGTASVVEAAAQTGAGS